MTSLPEAKPQILADPESLARQVADWLLEAATAKDVDCVVERGRHAAFLVAGEEKRAIFDRLRRRDDNLSAARLRPTGTLCLFGDAAAGKSIA